MKSVFLVEDESLVRLGLKAVMADHTDDYAVIGEAENGLNAVEQILALEPDIVLLDITIPGINGIEVLRRLREQQYIGTVMMLTCHEEISYAQQALRYGADDYILKTEISGGNLMNYLEKSKDRAPGPSGMRAQQATQSASAKRENFLCNIFMTGLETEAEFDRACDSYQLKLSRRNLYFILVHICDYNEVLKRYEREERDMLFTALDILLSESLGKLQRYELVRFSPENHIVLLSLEDEHSDSRVHDILWLCADRIRRNIATFLNIEVLVGISRSVSQICSINRDFSRVMKLLDRTFFLPETAVFWDDQRWDKRPFQKALAQLRGELRDMSDRKTAMDLTGAVERFMEVCRGDYVLPDKGAFLYLMQECCQSIAAGNGLDWTPLTGETTLRQLLERVEELQKFCGSVEQPQNHLVAQTMSYINENYASELTLEEIADRIGISPSYLSRIFSRERGQSVSSYITERRIEMAKHLICTTSLKHYEIAERCGLNSSAYFTSVFKKATGMTPNQYRNSVKK